VSLATILLVVLTLPPLAFGQGVISRITLSAPGFDIEIVDEKARNDFRVGGGPGNTLNGTPNWGRKSWIVQDWTQPVAEPDRSLLRVKATFTIDRRSARGPRPYVVFYVYDPVAAQGFVYLPGKGEPFYIENVNLLYRGDDFEGRWFRATSEWTTHVQPLIDKRGR
jgi:hypothetical protein